MRDHIFIDEKGKRIALDLVIPTKMATARSCWRLLCASCVLAKMPVQGAGVKCERAILGKELALKRNVVNPGNLVSVDQYQTKLGGRLYTSAGREKEEKKFWGGTIFHNGATPLLFLRHQISLHAGKTLVGKELFERMAEKFGVDVHHYRDDNGVFASQAFRQHCELRGQMVDFSRTGAHHQNACAERSIRTASEFARAMMVHQAIHWLETTDLSL